MIKIIISSLIFFTAAFLSCSMWDDVDKNAAFQIPVNDNINVTSVLNTSQWDYIPVFIQNDVSKNPITPYSINTVKIATNSNKSKIFFYVEFNNTSMTFPPYYIINLVNDYSCSGYVIQTVIDSAPANYQGKICSTVALTSNSGLIATASAAPVKSYEASIDLNSAGFILNDYFVISVYASASAIPNSFPTNVLNSSTKARWVKLR